MRLRMILVIGMVGAVVAGCSRSPASRPAAVGDVVITGGHQIGPRDYGRPVRLIAAALAVEPDVFRKAFSGVQPSRFGPPSHSRVHANKEALMKVLQPHGVRNERLDEVSNYYRFRPGAGELWTHRPAKAKAIIEAGELVGIEILDAGSGYCNAPEVTVRGFEHVGVTAEIAFDQDFAKNGRIVALFVAKNEPM